MRRLKRILFTVLTIMVLMCFIVQPAFALEETIAIAYSAVENVFPVPGAPYKMLFMEKEVLVLPCLVGSPFFLWVTAIT